MHACQSREFIGHGRQEASAPCHMVPDKATGRLHSENMVSDTARRAPSESAALRRPSGVFIAGAALGRGLTQVAGQPSVRRPLDAQGTRGSHG